MGNYIFSCEVLVQVFYDDVYSVDLWYDMGGDVILRFVNVVDVQVYDFCDNEVFGNIEKDVDYWWDVGIIDVYYDVYMDLVLVELEFNLYNLDWFIWIMQEQVFGVKFVMCGFCDDILVFVGCIIFGIDIYCMVLGLWVCIEWWV